MIATLSKRLHFARALKSRIYAMIWTGQTISGLGDGIFNIALAWQVLLMTHSGTAMGIVLVATSIPRLIFMLLGGVTADRLPRRLIILLSDSGRGLILLLMSLLGFMHLLQFWHLVLGSLIFGVVDSFFMPAIMAITPDLVQKDDLPSANALSSVGQTVTELIGPLLGAGLIALISPIGVFALNGLSFFVSVAFLMSVQIPERHVQAVLPPQVSVPEGELVLVAGEDAEESVGIRSTAREDEQEKEQPRGMLGVIADVRDGFSYVMSERWLWVSILCFSIGNLGIVGPLSVAMPKLVHDVYGQGSWLLGTIGSAGAIGSLLGLALIGQTKSLKRRGLLAYLSMIPAGIGLVLFGLPWSHMAFLVVGPLASAMFGFSIAYFNTVWFTIMQEMVPGDKLGRVISLDMLGSFAFIPISEMLGGIFTDHFGPPMVFLLGGTLSLTTSLLPLIVRDVREMK